MLIVGIDEVGRGSIAGPLVVGAVALETPIAGLKDSKLLSRKRRNELSELVYERARFTGLGWVSATELDRYGLSRALTLGAKRALAGLDFAPVRCVLDGNYNYVPKRYNAETLIGGDNIEPAIMAASVIAKVARDNYMINLAHKYPGYGFECNVGYCTSGHVEAIRKRGCLRQHRRSFEPVRTLLLQPQNKRLALSGRAASISPAR